MQRYDTIGHGYAQRRREDPELMARIAGALADANSVVNVGAGTGSYEPPGRSVIAVEPSRVMASQRRASGAPVLRALAQALPLRDGSLDAADDRAVDPSLGAASRAGRARALPGRERARRDRHHRPGGLGANVADGGLEYLNEVAELDLSIFVSPETIVGWLDRPATIETVEVARDSPDHSLISFWAHPERVLEPDARAATSGFARQPPEVVARVVNAVRADLESGAWDARHGHLRELERYDAGLRLVVARH